MQRRLALPEEYAERLSELRGLTADDHVLRRFEGRYLVQVCTQICIDLANHVIAAHRWPAARDGRDAVVGSSSTTCWTALSASGCRC